MRIYKLKLNLELVDMGETSEDEPQQQEERKHPMLEDPMDRQEKMVDRLVGMADMIGHVAPPFNQGSGNTMELAQSYDVPAQTFEEALSVLTKFNTLANTVGTPSSSSEVRRSPYLDFKGKPLR